MEIISFKADGLGDFAKAIEDTGKKFPATTERVLKKEGYQVSKDLKKRVEEEEKGHNWNRTHGKGNQDVKPLANSLSRDRVKHTGNNYTVSVSSSAHHYHLYELGHDVVGHRPKSRKGKEGVGAYKTIGHAKGRKTVARYMSQRSEYSGIIGQELLDEILKEAGFDA